MLWAPRNYLTWPRQQHVEGGSKGALADTEFSEKRREGPTTGHTRTAAQHRPAASLCTRTSLRRTFLTFLNSRKRI
ncbi:hypothetical protein SUGI_0200320 [Cryptomeria japonica]|nr:hypothetical protein SUGI_0200320 [Cryptomeria japonica]